MVSSDDNADIVGEEGHEGLEALFSKVLKPKTEMLCDLYERGKESYVGTFEQCCTETVRRAYIIALAYNNRHIDDNSDTCPGPPTRKKNVGKS